MKPIKKILFVIVSGLALSIVSGALSLGLYEFLHFSFWYSFIFLFVLQLIGSFLYEKYYKDKQIFDALAEYRAKPYKSYIVPLNCSYCNTVNNIEVDLDDTEFDCITCKKKNGVFVNFMTTSITEPINDANLL